MYLANHLAECTHLLMHLVHAILHLVHLRLVFLDEVVVGGALLANLLEVGNDFHFHLAHLELDLLLHESLELNELVLLALDGSW